MYQVSHDKLRPAILELTERYNIQLVIVREAMAVLCLQHGRPLSKRLATKIKEALPAYHVTYDSGSIRIWGGPSGAELRYDDAVRFDLQRDQYEGKFDYHLTSEHWTVTGYNEHPKALADLRLLLNSLQMRVVAYNAAVRQLQEAKKMFGPVGHLLESHYYSI